MLWNRVTLSTNKAVNDMDSHVYVLWNRVTLSTNKADKASLLISL